jgi:hypothetical protein
MIRRDYILRMIEEFIQALARIKSLKKGERWNDAALAVDEEFNRLIGPGAREVAKLSETELLAKIICGEPTQVVHHKTLLLTTLLLEAGDLAAKLENVEESLRCYLKGLHLLLEVLAGNEVFECPDFVPKVERFVEALQDAPLPTRTQVLLMQHYERSGQLARAEDMLYSILEAQPENSEALNFGVLFYERLQGLADAALAFGNLPRPELEAGLAELRRRQSARPSAAS